MTTTQTTFEASLAELETLVKRIEDGQLSLEESLSIFEQGINLSKQCQQKLTEAEQKIQVLTQSQELVDINDA